MYTEYKNLPQTSRVWIYQADRTLTNEEVQGISQKTIKFINNWTRHGDDLKGSFIIKYNQFLVLLVDESFNNVSGCSIDASVRLIKEIEQKLNIDFMDKMNITFKDRNNINMVKLSQFQQFVKEGKITSETIVFNNMINTKQDFESKWEVPVFKSWHKRFLV